MTNGEREWLDHLRQEIWNKRYDKRTLAQDELARVEAILTQHQHNLVFDPCSGLFGLSVALSVLEAPEYPHLPCTGIFAVDTPHLKPLLGGVEQAHAWISKWVYTDRNKEIRSWLKLPELRPLWYYDY